MLICEPPKLKQLFQLTVEFENAIVLSDVPLGTRRILTTRRGSFKGDRIGGDVLGGGGDWVLHRSDGVADLDIRFTLRTNEGELINLYSRGIFDASANVLKRIRAGDVPEPREYYFRTTVFFETASEEHLRLNRIVAVGIGTRLPDGMETEVYEVT